MKPGDLVRMRGQIFPAMMHRKDLSPTWEDARRMGMRDLGIMLERRGNFVKVLTGRGTDEWIDEEFLEAVDRGDRETKKQHG